ncbi:hypothetical protein HA49_22445 [Tatumella morbirosei]|uniref:Uncharacterized protein n=1 Tax=Tatumella morbirosei TaxID=642227 RepID=A0A0F5BW12_9GAMM|nr:hypothetical protein HA49_22445 [Tatumella morbirosei]
MPLSETGNLLIKPQDLLITFSRQVIAVFNIWGYSDFAYSQGGAKFPTGGKSVFTESPRALQPLAEGQQIRCNSGADG